MSKGNETVESSRPTRPHPLIAWLLRHQEKLWWLHSLYALALGIGFIWLGKQNFAFLRVAVFHIIFIWLSSLMLPKLLDHPRVPARWAPRLKLVVNYFNKNLYQQMLFFVLPIYYASATLWSRNTAFVIVVGLSAVLSTVDVIYDRHLSVKRQMTAAFFAFNLFALVNVMLPILWSVSNTLTTRVGAILAFVGFLTLGYPASQSRALRIGAVAAIGLSMLILVEAGRPLLPPAPLRLASAEFGRDFEKESLQIVSPLEQVEPASSLRVYGLTAIKAPLGLREKLQHRWRQDGKLVCASPFHDIVGGREEGFRLWTSCVFPSVPPGAILRVDLETEGGQLIGRAVLKAAG
jgi:hypothetical protein